MTNNAATTLPPPHTDRATHYNTIKRRYQWWSSVRVFLTFACIIHALASTLLAIAGLLPIAEAVVATVQALAPKADMAETLSDSLLLLGGEIMYFWMVFVPLWFLWVCRKYAINVITDTSITLKRLGIENVRNPQ